MASEGMLFISGGGGAEISFEFDRRYFSFVGKRSILYIPLAWDSGDFCACERWFHELLSLHSLGDAEVKVASDSAQLVALDLSSFGGIYIGGGNTFRLMAQLREARFVHSLRGYLQAGGVIYGGSAGGIVFGASLQAVHEERYPQYPYQDDKGLGFLSNFSLRCHVEESQLRELALLAQRNRIEILGIDEAGGLILHGNVAEPHGRVWRISQDGTIRAINSHIDVPD